MDWISIVSNFASAAVGAVFGGLATAYAIGRWRGEIETKLGALVEWRKGVDARLGHGADELTNVRVLEAKLEETNQNLGLMRVDLREGFAEVTRQMERGSERFVHKDECKRTHKSLS